MKRVFQLEEARRLRAEGFTYRELADLYGRCESSISEAVRGIHRTRVDRVRDRRQPASSLKIHDAGPDCTFVTKWAKKPIRSVIDRAALRQILADRNGDIPIDTLMARITP